MFSGDRILFERFELPRALLHRNMLVFYVVLIGVLSQLNLFSPLLLMTGAERLAVVTISVLGGTLPLLIALVIGEWLQAPGSIRVYRASWVIALASGCSLVAAEVYVQSVVDRPLPGLGYLLVIWTCFYVIMQATSHFVMLRLMKRVLIDMRGAEALPRGADGRAIGPREIEIKGQRFLPGSLVRITAEGNYIRVTDQQAQHLLPGPFGPVIESLPEALGLQVSRSEWVAAGAVAGLRKVGREMILDLRNGHSLRVAQSRRKAVAEWVAALLPDLSAPQGEVPSGGRYAGMARSIQSGK